MSYILDALKRAESERDRGAVPGLLSQHGAARRDPAQTPTSTPVWLLAGAALVLLLLGAGLWRWLAPTALPSLPQATPSVPTANAELPVLATAPTTSAAAQPPAPTVATTVPVTGQPTQALTRTPVAPVTTAAPAATSTATAAAPNKATLQAVTPPTATASPVVLAGPAPAPAAPKSAPTKDNNNVPMLSELPQSLRSQIPAFSIAGTVYSESPTQRLLLTEIGVFSPGSSVVPGVLLEEIHAHSAIFNFHGTRFQIDH